MPDHPAHIGRYEIIEEIGRGGMATVYRARDPQLRRDVALKIIAPQLSVDRKFVQRFQREARLVARLDHPHITSIYDSGEFDGRPYIVMRLLKNGTLRQMLDQGPIDPERLIDILFQISDALHAAHQKGIIHRDIKPSNILFDERGQAYVSDFGIAKMVDSQTNLTGTSMVGTPIYMSPEQFQARDIDGRTDQYSLAVVAFEALAGVPPFEGDMLTLAFKHVNEPPPPIPEHAPDAPPALVELLNQMLEKQPEERLPDMNALVQELRRLQMRRHAPTPPLIPRKKPDIGSIETLYQQGLAALAAEQFTTARQLLSQVFKIDPRYKDIGQKLHDAEVALATQIRFQEPAAPPGVSLTQDATLPPLPAQPGPRRRWPVLVGVAALLVLLIGGGGYGYSSGFFDGLLDPGSSPTAEPTMAVAAAADTPTDTPSPPPPTATDIPAPDPTARPSDTPTPPPTEAPAVAAVEPTRTSPPDATVTTAPTDTPTPTPTADQATGPASSGGGLPLTFDGEAFGTWVRGDEPNGTLQQASNIARSGQSARLDYIFGSGDNDYVVFLQNNAVSGQPNLIEVWVYGDGSGHFLNAWVRDAEGQTWQVPLGRVSHTGWQAMTGEIDPDQEWPWTHISGPRNNTVEYPLTLRGFVLDDLNNGDTGSGTIYLDDVRFFTGTAGSGGSTASPTQAATTVAGGSTATPEPFDGEVGRILYTSGNTLLTTDPTWSSPQEVGTVAQNTCSGTPSTIDGASFSVSRGFFCTLGEGTRVCPSPNGAMEVIFNGTYNEGFALTIRPAGDQGGGDYIFDSKEFDLSEGLRWSPNSQSFLFVLGDTVYKGSVDRTYGPLFSPAYNPIFSPDGSQIVYRKPTGPGVNDVFVADASGENQRNVTNVNNVDKSCAVWRP